MKYPSPYIGLFAVTAVLALPFDIKMGAYIGDRAIGFEDDAGTTTTLQGATANGPVPANGQPAALEGITSGFLPRGMGNINDMKRNEQDSLTAEQQEALEEAQEEADISDNMKRNEQGGLTAEQQEALEEAQEEADISDNMKRNEQGGLTAEQQEALEEAQEKADISDNTKRELSEDEAEEIDEESDIDNNMD